jgi:hypothetical protein
MIILHCKMQSIERYFQSLTKDLQYCAKDLRAVRLALTMAERASGRRA